MKISNYLSLFVCTLFLFQVTLSIHAQPRGERPPQFQSPEITSDGGLVFRIHAPNAENVRLSSSDIPGLGWGGVEMEKKEEGVWETTFESIDSGAYRYNFNVDGISVMDPRNTSISESNMNVWSVVYVPGSDFMDTKKIPHGAVSEVTYFSSSLDRFRRMHVYTPPGYETGSQKYPVFYLLHGAMDSDDSWSTVGRANFILDNLIASKKAKPMIVVMPDGHTGSFQFGRPLAMNEFVTDFNSDVKPYIEKHYRVYTDRKHTAMAGLSMGGAHTLDIAIPNVKDYAYIGVYSSGVFGIAGPGPGSNNEGPSWEERNADVLKNADLKKGLELLWFATGKEDFLLETSKATVKMFENHDFDVIYKETEGGHTWINWREYLNEFAPKLFQ